MALTPDGIAMVPGEILGQLDQGPQGQPVPLAPMTIETVSPPRKYSWQVEGGDAPITAGGHPARGNSIAIAGGSPALLDPQAEITAERIQQTNTTMIPTTESAKGGSR